MSKIEEENSKDNNKASRIISFFYFILKHIKYSNVFYHLY